MSGLKWTDVQRDFGGRVLLREPVEDQRLTYQGHDWLEHEHKRHPLLAIYLGKLEQTVSKAICCSQVFEQNIRNPTVPKMFSVCLYHHNVYPVF